MSFVFSRAWDKKKFWVRAVCKTRVRFLVGLIHEIYSTARYQHLVPIINQGVNKTSMKSCNPESLYWIYSKSRHNFWLLHDLQNFLHTFRMSPKFRVNLLKLLIDWKLIKFQQLLEFRKLENISSFLTPYSDSLRYHSINLTSLRLKGYRIFSDDRKVFNLGYWMDACQWM